ncbi:MAG: glycosyl transferase [Gammaproteobacteria bacterium]|nr:glycosyl transferase [Gammaproteobacteria bacterium]
MHLLVTLGLWIVGAPAILACLYLFVLTLLSAKAPLPPSATREMRFDLIVPAHNEEAVIANVVRSLRGVDWPADRFKVVVVADNCTDSTAAVARAAGAHVLERFDGDKRGKGYALQFAFEASRREEWADAVAVVDADALVSPNFVEAIACRMQRGAQAVQVHYGVSNTGVSWRTRLLSIAKAAFHIVRSRARERLKVSCGLRGNGWSVTHALLEKVPYSAFSLTEDLEYGITLGMHGYRVAYADEAHADAEMVSGEKESRKQRQRWEGGRFALIRSRTLPLLVLAVRARSLICLDLALDLLVLPLSYVALNVVALLVFALLVGGPAGGAWAWLALGCIAVLVLHILRGWQLSGSGLQGLLDLARAPGFLLWKIVVMLRGGDSKEWVRTKREGS